MVELRYFRVVYFVKSGTLKCFLGCTAHFIVSLVKFGRVASDETILHLYCGQTPSGIWELTSLLVTNLPARLTIARGLSIEHLMPFLARYTANYYYLDQIKTY